VNVHRKIPQEIKEIYCIFEEWIIEYQEYFLGIKAADA
jgi:hypothetical protein